MDDETAKILSAINYLDSLEIPERDPAPKAEEPAVEEEELKFSAAPVAPVDDNENW